MSVHVRTPGELIASIPVLLGFMPLDSIVIVGIGASGRVAPVMRLDRGDCLIREVAHSVAAAAVGHLARARATSVVLVSFKAPGSVLQCAALDAIRPLLGDHLEVADAWVVADGRFRAPECPDPGCCPDTGRVVPMPADGLPSYGRSWATAHGSRAGVEARAAGDRRKSARAALRRASRARARAVAEHGPCGAETLSARGAAECVHEPPCGAALSRWRREKLEHWRSALAAAMAGDLPTEAEAGRLAAGLCDVVVRDAAVISMVPGRSAVADALCHDPSASGVHEALSVMIAAEHAVRPSQAEVSALVALAEHLASLTDEGAAPALTLAGLALWWSGDNVTSGYVIGCALAARPGYRLAELVACALEAQMPPGWQCAA